jgi:hypothetical protein
MRAPSSRRREPRRPAPRHPPRAPILIVVAALAAPAWAGPLEVTGNAGQLGEWELSATVAAAGAAPDELSGPLTMTHVGLCTQDGPERKSGEIRLRMSDSSSRLRATLLLDGVECTYTGTLTGAYSGLMSCPDQRAVPLTLWVK